MNFEDFQKRCAEAGLRVLSDSVLAGDEDAHAQSLAQQALDYLKGKHDHIEA